MDVSSCGTNCRGNTNWQTCLCYFLSAGKGVTRLPGIFYPMPKQEGLTNRTTTGLAYGKECINYWSQASSLVAPSTRVSSSVTPLSHVSSSVSPSSYVSSSVASS
ncbi:hypothetical protein DPMN_099158 [Dreissena polymorpha]|uniref:Uncharacterized protein n=1 Tax=Dreissena polymorpha TaxID=45954 RepID=A0A9D4LDF2_DREPO|nr:hypothetical protein DPMN_099158 [Dreissena polymorpha]